MSARRPRRTLAGDPERRARPTGPGRSRSRGAQQRARHGRVVLDARARATASPLRVVVGALVDVASPAGRIRVRRPGTHRPPGSARAPHLRSAVPSGARACAARDRAPRRAPRAPGPGDALSPREHLPAAARSPGAPRHRPMIGRSSAGASLCAGPVHGSEGRPSARAGSRWSCRGGPGQTPRPPRIHGLLGPVLLEVVHRPQCARITATPCAKSARTRRLRSSSSDRGITSANAPP